jgi:hypothetical protein
MSVLNAAELCTLKMVTFSWAPMAHAYNPSFWKAEIGRIVANSS